MGRIRIISKEEDKLALVRNVLSLSLLRKLEPDEAVEILRTRLKKVMEEGLYKTHSHHIEAYLRDPDNTRFSNEDLEFLCRDLDVKNSSFVLLGNHCQFMAGINENETRVYDPMKTGIQIIRTSNLREENKIVFLDIYHKDEQ